MLTMRQPSPRRALLPRSPTAFSYHVLLNARPYHLRRLLVGQHGALVVTGGSYGPEPTVPKPQAAPQQPIMITVETRPDGDSSGRFAKCLASCAAIIGSVSAILLGCVRCEGLVEELAGMDFAGAN
ncbi:hypothetical protein EHS25_007227 [Saitozyma podzolica]|uniref:Uncharacterized protein n=1 Tax=Saitozyma podzolica TaxID=1890683 RepID=A0A427XND2_9TREE|nr:hypothetical protein EHS25_007227 [Saitozyma podzolica]